MTELVQPKEVIAARAARSDTAQRSPLTCAMAGVAARSHGSLAGGRPAVRKLTRALGFVLAALPGTLMEFPGRLPLLLRTSPSTSTASPPIAPGRPTSWSSPPSRPSSPPGPRPSTCPASFAPCGRRGKDGETFGLLFSNDNLDGPVKLDVRLVEADQIATPDLSTARANAVDGIVFDEDGNPKEYHVLKEHPGGDKAVLGARY